MFFFWFVFPIFWLCPTNISSFKIRPWSWKLIRRFSRGSYKRAFERVQSLRTSLQPRKRGFSVGFSYSSTHSHTYISLQIELGSWNLVCRFDSCSECFRLGFLIFIPTTICILYPLHYERKTSHSACFFHSMNGQFVRLLYFKKIRLKKQRIAMPFVFPSVLLNAWKCDRSFCKAYLNVFNFLTLKNLEKNPLAGDYSICHVITSI